MSRTLSISLGIVAFSLLLASCNKQQKVEARPETGPVKVQAASVAAKDLRRIVDSVGTLFPYEEVVVSAEVDGRVEQVNVDLGDAVSTGQVLVRISDEEQKYLVAQNEAQLRQALEKLGLSAENDQVKDIRETPEVRRAQADLFEAEQRFKRVRALVDQGIGAANELDQAKARYDALRAGYDATLNQTRNLIQDVQRSRAVLELQRKKLRDTVVKAPFAASVKERQVTMGQYVRANSPLFTLVKTDPIRLRIEVPERMAPWIRTGQRAEVLVEAFADRKFEGKVWRISPTVDQSKRTFIVETLIANPAGALKPGSYARARLETEKVERVVVVPRKAVNYVFGANKTYVVSSGVVEARDVKLGDPYGESVEILEGVKEGEQVAVSQLSRLDTGVRVAIAAQ
ncbi:MAG: efflux RND transporter periplasmic adaptor subunit [Bryobacteraceae bacterium]|nr:efflux RND transporter periplasmic adaptor subunit [Bryobacteraceae bacterium]